MILVVLCAIERGVDSAKIASPSMIVIYDEMNATIYVYVLGTSCLILLVINQQVPLVMPLGNGCVVALIGRLRGT